MANKRSKFVDVTGLFFASLLVAATFQNCGDFKTKLPDMTSLGSGSPIGGSAGSKTCAAEQRGLADVASRRLTKSELNAAMTQLFGAEVVQNAAVQAAFGNFTSETSRSYGRSFDPTLSSSYLDGLFAATEAAADVLVATPSLMEKSLQSCSISANLDGCVNQLLGPFATRVLRRPISSELRADITKLVAAESGINKLKLGVMSLLLSPYFYQQVEVGEKAEGGRLRLSQYEVASRLSFRLIGSAPDDELLAAASKGELATLAQLKTQAKRLLATAQAKKFVRNFFSSWLALERTPDPDPKLQALRGINAAGLGAEAAEETLRFVSYTIFDKNGSFRDLYTSRVVFPFTERLANLYGVQMSNGPVPSVDNRGGIVLRLSLLINNSLSSNPIVRGVHLRSLFLCQDIPQPDPAAVAARVSETAFLSHATLSNRNFVAQTTGVPACLSCHSMINPLGFALENFDGFGMPRTTELVYNDQGQVIARHPIDTFVEDLRISSVPTPATAEQSLINQLANSELTQACMSTRLLEYSRQRASAAADGCQITESKNVLSFNSPILDFMVASVASEDIFWKADAPVATTGN